MISIFHLEALSLKLNKKIEQESLRALNENRVFSIAFSGGSLAKQLQLCCYKMDTKHWKILFADERCVPLDHVDSNYGLFKDLFEFWDIKQDQVLTIDPLLVNDPAKAAIKYAKECAQIPGFPVIDVVLLGMGPDGHTCSLFPGHPLLQENALLVAPITDSPKPPSCRITLTFPVVNSGKCVIFVCCGESKAERLHEILDLKMDYPATRVAPKGELHWYLDHAAASKLQ